MLGWYNWRSLGQLDDFNIGHLILIAIIFWLLIQAIDLLYQRIKRKGK